MKSKVLDNVDRVSDLSGSDFLKKYVKKNKPVIIKNVQRKAGISNLATQEDSIRSFGDVLLQVQNNYTSPAETDTEAAPRFGLSQKVRNKIFDMPIKEYFNHIEKSADTDLLCVEYPTPKEILDLMVTPDQVQALSKTEDMVSFLFAANKGNYAHLHFDGDFRHVFLYQIFGKKRVVMVPIESTDKLAPSMNFSKLLIQNMEEGEKQDLFRYLGAFDCVIEPGDTIYFPPSIWHYIEYIDNGMSVNFRFGRDAFSQNVINANRVPFYPELQMFLHHVSMIKDENEKGRLQASALEEIKAVLQGKYPTTEARHQKVSELYRSLLKKVCSSSERLPRQVYAGCLISDAMAVERYDSPNKRWRSELQLGEPL